MAVPVIPVVCALIERRGEILVAQRPPHKHLPLKWEFPGGKVEPGEAPTLALQREIEEELRCRITDLQALPPADHHYDDRHVRLHPFVARLAADSPEPRPVEHLALRWVRPDQLAHLDLAAADLPVVDQYLALRTVANTDS